MGWVENRQKSIEWIHHSVLQVTYVSGVCNTTAACEGRNQRWGDDVDDACENDLDQCSPAFRRLRPAGAVAPSGPSTDAIVFPRVGSATGSDQRLRLGRPIFQRRSGVLHSRQSYGDLHSSKVVTRSRHRRLPRRSRRLKMNEGGTALQDGLSQRAATDPCLNRVPDDPRWSARVFRPASRRGPIRSRSGDHPD
jgi:hypothetical protein